MSNRETQLPSSIQKWKGVDQRIQPTLVQDGFFVMSRGVYFGLGDNAQRLEGKLVSAFMGEPIFSLTICGDLLLIQTLNNLYMTPIASL